MFLSGLPFVGVAPPCRGRVLILMKLNAYCLHVMYVIEHFIYVCNFVTLNKNDNMVAIYSNAPCGIGCTLVIATAIMTRIYKSCNFLMHSNNL